MDQKSVLLGLKPTVLTESNYKLFVILSLPVSDICNHSFTVCMTSIFKVKYDEKI